MAITPRMNFNFTPQNTKADTSTPFDVTLAVVDTAENLVLVPVSKRGRQVDIVNEGPGDAAVKLDGTAVITDVLLREGDSVSWPNLDLATKVSFINVSASEPRLRGVLLSGPA